MTKNLKKFTAEKIDILSKIAIYLSLGLHHERPSYRRSLQPSKENPAHFYFCGSFLPFWNRTGIPKPDQYPRT
jgi:hypothetical protein